MCKLLRVGGILLLAVFCYSKVPVKIKSVYNGRYLDTSGAFVKKENLSGDNLYAKIEKKDAGKPFKLLNKEGKAMNLQKKETLLWGPKKDGNSLVFAEEQKGKGYIKMNGGLCLKNSVKDTVVAETCPSSSKEKDNERFLFKVTFMSGGKKDTGSDKSKDSKDETSGKERYQKEFSESGGATPCGKYCAPHPCTDECVNPSKMEIPEDCTDVLDSGCSCSGCKKCGSCGSARGFREVSRKISVPRIPRRPSRCTGRCGSSNMGILTNVLLKGTTDPGLPGKSSLRESSSAPEPSFLAGRSKSPLGNLAHPSRESLSRSDLEGGTVEDIKAGVKEAVQESAKSKNLIIETATQLMQKHKKMVSRLKENLTRVVTILNQMLRDLKGQGTAGDGEKTEAASEDKLEEDIGEAAGKAASGIPQVQAAEAGAKAAKAGAKAVTDKIKKFLPF